MKSIRLVEFRFHRHTFEKKRIERQMMDTRKIGEDEVEGTLVIFAPICRCEHADKQQFRAARLDLDNNLVEIVAYRRWLDATQRVVGAERQDHEIWLVGERPVEPRKTARGGVAGDPRIDHPRRDPVFVEPCLQPHRESLSGRQPIAGGNAVAEIEDHRHTRRRRKGNKYRGQRDGGEKSAWERSLAQGRAGALASHCVESPGRRAISSETFAAPAGLPPSRFRRRMTTSIHPGGPIVMLDDVHLTLGSAAGPVNILRGISLDVGAGETVSVVGPSGSGKSTLLMIVGGLERPSSGRVVIDGTDIGGLDEDALARLRRARIGIVFQSFHLIATMTALENVAIPLELAGRTDAFATAAEALAAVGLGHRLTHYPGQLSGGEQQRVAIARAFIAGPKLLLADEPTGNLDDTTGNLVIHCLFEQHARHGTTLVLVTHDPAIAERCERQILLMDGKIVEDRRLARGRVAAIRHAR